MTEDLAAVADANYIQSMRTVAPLLDGGGTRTWDEFTQ